MVLPPVAVLLMLAALILMLGALRSPKRAPADGPRSVLVAAVRWLPADHHEWGQAMLVELDGVQGRRARWQFGLSCARAALVAAVVWGRPSPGRTVLVAGVFAAAGAGIFAASPRLQVFAVALTVGMSACAWLAAVRLRSTRRGIATAGMTLRTGLLAGVPVCVGLTVYGARFPVLLQPTVDLTDLVTIVLAVTLTGYVWLSLVPPRSVSSSSQISRWGLIGTAAVSAVWIADQIATTVFFGHSFTGYSVAAVLCVFFATGLLAGRSSNNARAGLVAGMWAGLGGAMSLFLIAMTGTYSASYPTALDAYLAMDDNLGGVIVMLVLAPLAGALFGAFGGTLATVGLPARSRWR